MEDNKLVSAFRQLIRLIIDADKDLANSINSETIAREAAVEDLISKITAETQARPYLSKFPKWTTSLAFSIKLKVFLKLPFEEKVII